MGMLLECKLLTGLDTEPHKVTTKTFIIIIITTIIIIIITSYYFAGFFADFKMLLSELIPNKSQHAVLVSLIHILRFVRIRKVKLHLSTVIQIR
jgi:hypothetical protein